MKLEQPVNENYPKHQDLSGIPTEKLKAYLAKQSQQQSSGEATKSSVFALNCSTDNNKV